MNLREIVYLVPLALLVIWMGLFPRPFVLITEKTLTHLLTQVQTFIR
jgi:NADH-quinone oxidoreductase subunit M